MVDLSSLLKVNPPTVLNLVRRLSQKGCLKYEKGMIIFTDKCKKAYLELVENHRVMETLMTNSGMDPDKACILWENIDYLIDHTSVDKVFDKLGKPESCTHGKKIEQLHGPFPVFANRITSDHMPLIIFNYIEPNFNFMSYCK